MSNMYVPEDILVNIFTRLPLKTLKRFQCVSKQWNNLLLQPNYSLCSRSYPMILLSIQPFHAIHNTTLPSYNNMDQTMIKRPPFENRKVDDIIVIGTFEGIVVVVIKDKIQSDILLYNLFNGSFEKVPNPPLIPLYQGCGDTYGFCYGTALDDLKIVRLRPPADSYTYWRVCDVFSFKNQSWSRLPSYLIGYYKYVQDVGTFVNGFLYWTAHEIGHGRLIVALDVTKMEFSMIEFSRKCRFPVVALGELDGHLGMVCCQDNGAKCELWVMNNDHDIKTSWSNIWSSTILSRGNDLYKFKPRCLLDKGKILMYKRPNQVVIYDARKDSCTEVIETLSSEVRRSQIIEYVETVVLPSDLYSVLSSLSLEKKLKKKNYNGG